MPASTSIRIEQSLYDEAKVEATIEHLNTAGQITCWAEVEQAAMDNPDLPVRQRQLSELTGISQATISTIENGRASLGVERAKVLARALKCHPAVLVFPTWELPSETAA